MNDPIAAFEKIRDNFILYVKTAFGTRFPGLEEEREELLRQPGVLNQEPWLEPLPSYQSSGKTIDDLDSSDLPGLDSHQQELFKTLVKCGLFGDKKLHRHQVAMLERALTGRHCVVTAGTGSGKTEAFLLPLFAQLVKEVPGWSRPGQPHEHVHDWWKNLDWQDSCKKGNKLERSFRVPQRGHEERRPAVRALILYPMNALVEDQLTRLRRALNSDQAQTWFEEQSPGNRIYLGRYNGSTPVAGHERRRTGNPHTEKILELCERMREADKAYEAARQHARKNPQDSEVIDFFPSLNGAEMRSRWDMQDHPPDILITNFSMLSIMMMREADEPIFEKTREWLEGEDLPEDQLAQTKESRVFHLIVDELHLYRGTAGAEVAYLLRLLLHRLGLHPNHPQLRILASSASLEAKDPQSRQFLKDFFGSEDFDVIEGMQEPMSKPTTALPLAPFEHLAIASEITNATLAEAAEMLGADSTPEGFFDALDSLDLRANLLDACNIDCTVRAVSLTDMAKRLFPGHSLDAARQAVRGVLLTSSLLEQYERKRTIPSFRIHCFFRNIEGLWASSKPLRDTPDHRPIGKLYPDTRIISHDGHRVLELLYCEHCGTVFFGGQKLVTPEQEIELLSTSPDIEGIPERQAARFVERRTYREFGVFWPQGGQEYDNPSHWRHSKFGETRRGQNAWAEWRQASLNTRTGHLRLTHEAAKRQPEQWERGYIFHVEAPHETKKTSTERSLACAQHAARTSAAARTGSLQSVDSGRVSQRSAKSSLRSFSTSCIQSTPQDESLSFSPTAGRTLRKFRTASNAITTTTLCGR